MKIIQHIFGTLWYIIALASIIEARFLGIHLTEGEQLIAYWHIYLFACVAMLVGYVFFRNSHKV